MNRLAELVRQLAYRFRAERNDLEMDEEMRLHMELRAEQAREKGLDPDAAAAEARRRFGNPTLLRERSRDAWGWTYLDGWARDTREALRSLRGSPGFTATAVLSLALGIGANTAIFSLINALLLRELPVKDPRELVQLTMNGNEQGYFTNPIWEQVRDNQQAFAGALAFSYAKFDLARSGKTEPVEGLWVSGEFFQTLGVPPVLGRVFDAADDRRGCSGPDGPVAVIGHRLWQVRYGGDEAAIGSTIHLDREPFRIVGVTPRWFTGLDTDRAYGVAVPLGCDAILHKDGSWLDMRSRWWLRVMGRMPSWESLPAVAEHLRAISPGVFAATLPADREGDRKKRYLELELTARPAATGFSAIWQRYGSALYALMGIAGLVLLIACANIANLLLARSAQREREISMRMALGAGRARLVRRLLCESLLLAFAGAAAGLALAILGSQFLVRLIATQSRPVLVDLAPDVRVLAFTIGAAVFTALVFGLAPALRATRVRLNDVLKEGARGASQNSRQMWLGKAIVAGQVALSLMLLAGAAMFAGTMRNLMREDLGFDPRNVLAVQVDLEKAGTPKEQRIAAFERMCDRLRALPGVEAAAQVDLSPLGGFGWNETVEPEGYTPQTRDEALMYFNTVSPGYFETMRTPLVVGRDFAPSDSAGSPKVIIIDEASARRYWGADNPIGKSIVWSRFGQPGPVSYEVVGVVRAVKYRGIDERPKSTGYVPAAQEEDPGGRTHFVIRSSTSASPLATAVESAVAEVSPEASIAIRELEAQVSESVAEQRLVAMLSLGFAGLALLLAMVGLYGVTSSAAARRRGEIGIRIALGAQPGSVVWLMVRDLALVLAIGLAAGWAASVGLGGLIESLLFGVQPGDPRSLGLAALILAVVSAVAAYLPARRASKLQPIAVLREE